MRENNNNYYMRGFFGWFFFAFVFVFRRRKNSKGTRMVQKCLVERWYPNWDLKLRIIKEGREERTFRREEKAETKRGRRDVAWLFGNSKGTRRVNDYRRKQWEIKLGLRVVFQVKTHGTFSVCSMESWKVLSDSTGQQDSRRETERQARMPGKDQVKEGAKEQREPWENWIIHCLSIPL